MTPHLTTDRLHLVLALASALTLTAWGIAMALVVLAVVAARRGSRQWLLARSAATGRAVLPAPQRVEALHPAGHLRKAVARP